MKILVIGAGQLGSRHLQALRNTSFGLDITVCDPSLDSLKVARERYEGLAEVGKHQIQYSEALPQAGSWDLSIIATNASQRRAVLQHVLDRLQVKNFILEKILFTKQADYEWSEKLAQTSLKNAWVNCCMRQMPVYQEIKNNLKDNNFNFVVSGSNYGLVTNAIHYLDYAAWLAHTPVYSLDTTQLEAKAVPSKRKGYLELNGNLRAHFKSGAVASITCFADGTLPISVEIHSKAQRHIVLESERKTILWNAERNWVREEKDAVIPFQSQLTTELVKLFHENKPCSLPTLAESVQVHLNLLKPLKEFLIMTNQTQTEDYPFT